jgi:chemotaxis protein methyltransferase CheR
MEFDYSEIENQGMKLISDEEFNLIRNLVYEKVGINLTGQKKALVTGRLQKILRDRKFQTFRDYYNFVISDKSGEALSELVDKISTNHTFFGREADHFNYFRNKVLPEIVQRKQLEKSNDIRIWSAGCSTGEEPYTLVMLMKEFFGKDYIKWDAGILATDISTVALSKASVGIYEDNRLHNFDTELKKKYFKLTNDEKWQVSDEIKREVTYRRFNLMNDFFPFKKEFDVIFCRNVIIYFDTETRINLVNKFYENTVQNGYLFIGHSETIDRKYTQYKYIAPAIYQKK